MMWLCYVWTGQPSYNPMCSQYVFLLPPPLKLDNLLGLLVGGRQIQNQLTDQRFSRPWRLLSLILRTVRRGIGP